MRKTENVKTDRQVPTRGLVIGAAIALVLAGTMASCTAGVNSGAASSSAGDARVAECREVIQALNGGIQSALTAFQSQIDLTMSAAAGGSLETILLEQQRITDSLTAANDEMAATTATCE